MIVFAKFRAFCFALIVLLVASSALAAHRKKHHFMEAEKAKVSGEILSRDGDHINVHEKKSDEIIVINIGDPTRIERKTHKISFYRHKDLDVTALLPGLTIEADGVGTANGELNAIKISFTPDDFAVAVAEEKQVLANEASAKNAQSSANEAMAAAAAAQNSATQAQTSADQANVKAEAAGVVGVADAEAIASVNQRVSDLDKYQLQSETDVFFDRDSAVLKNEAKPALADLAKLAKSFDGYLIEIAGYASDTLPSRTDQKLSEERAAAVARFLYESQNIPMRRILMPVGYGSTHHLTKNSDSVGRELNRRVDVKILVNKSMQEGL